MSGGPIHGSRPPQHPARPAPISAPETKPSLALETPAQPPQIGPLASAWAQLRQSAVVHSFQEIGDVIAQTLRLFPKEARSATRVVIYPGQFDPFHVDHLREVAGSLGPGERAVVLPTAGALGSSKEQHAHDWLRIAIARASTKDDGRIRVSNLALRKGFRTAPALIEAMVARYPEGTRLAMLMGSDNYANLAEWRDVEKLLGAVDIIVSHRPGYAIADAKACLPAALAAEYEQVGEGLLVNAKTGRRIELRALETTGIGSHQVLETILGLREDRGSVLELMTERGAAWASQHFYPDVDLDARQARWLYPKAVAPALERAFGAEAMAWILADGELFDGLVRLPRDSEEVVASVAGLFLEAAARAPGGLPAHPQIYSRAVALALDPSFREAHREMAAPELFAEPTEAKKRPSRAEADVQLLSQVREVFKPLLQRVMAASAKMVLCPADDILLPMAEAAPPATRFPEGQTVRLYLGIGAGANVEAIQREGLSSKAERKEGRDARDARLAAGGPTTAAIQHIIGDSSQGLFVSASLSPQVAKSYAGAGGLFVTLEVPASELTFTNDPALWATTFLRREGNPERFLHEVLLDRVSPEQIAHLERLDAKDLEGGFGKLSAYVKSQSKVLAAALRGAVSRATGRSAER